MASTRSGWVWPEHPLSPSHPPKPYGRRQGTNLPTPSTTKHLPIDTNRQSTISSPTYLPCRQHHQPLPEGAKGNGGQKSAQSGGRISLCTQRVDPPIGPYAQIGSARRVLACRTPAATLASATEAPSTTSVLFIETHHHPHDIPPRGPAAVLESRDAIHDHAVAHAKRVRGADTERNPQRIT